MSIHEPAWSLLDYLKLRNLVERFVELLPARRWIASNARFRRYRCNEWVSDTPWVMAKGIGDAP